MEMAAAISAPVEWIESVGELKFPPKTDKRLQELMNLNNEGELTDSERQELEALVELSQALSLVRAEALHLLGKNPERASAGSWNFKLK